MRFIPNVARQLLTIAWSMRERGWAAAVVREAGDRHHRHRHDRAHAVWSADGRNLKGLQPEEQGQEELNT